MRASTTRMVCPESCRLLARAREAGKQLVAGAVYLTVGVEALYSKRIRTVARAIPARRLLAVTDNPGGPKGFMGKPGIPVLVQDIIQGIAEARKITLGEVTQTGHASLLELIRNDSWLAAVYATICKVMTTAGGSAAPASKGPAQPEAWPGSSYGSHCRRWALSASAYAAGL